jgi:hypothetical protein
MPLSRLDIESSASPSARVPEGYRKPSHGKGLLKPWPKGVSGRPPDLPSNRYAETLALARQHSADAMRTLIARLGDADGRVAVTAANLILERAFGRVREQRTEEPQPMQLDLSSLSGDELQILIRLVTGDRLRAIPVDAPESEVPGIEVIEGKSE